jgi:hypothetical protein
LLFQETDLVEDGRAFLVHVTSLFVDVLLLDLHLSVEGLLDDSDQERKHDNFQVNLIKNGKRHDEIFECREFRLFPD